MSRGFLSAVVLIVIALACLAISRKLESERRLLRKLRTRGSIDAHNDLPLSQLNELEREAAEALAGAGVIGIREGRCHIRSSELSTFRRKRLRLVVSGAFTALALAGLTALLILRHF